MKVLFHLLDFVCRSCGTQENDPKWWFCLSNNLFYFSIHIFAPLLILHGITVKLGLRNHYVLWMAYGVETFKDRLFNN